MSSAIYQPGECLGGPLDGELALVREGPTMFFVTFPIQRDEQGRVGVRVDPPAGRSGVYCRHGKSNTLPGCTESVSVWLWQGEA